MKILIISVFFPPENSIASLRPYSWAKYWSRWKHDVTVLTTPKPSMPSNLSMPCHGFRVIEVPVPGLHMIRSLLGGLGGTRSFERPTVCSSNPLRRLTIRVRMRYGIFSLCRMPDLHDLWAMRSISAVSGEKWDVAVSTGGPYSTHIVGYLLKRRKLVDRWVVDWRDLWTENHVYPGLPGFRILERWIENAMHRQADVVTTVSEPLANHLRSRVGDKVHVVYNGFDPEDYANLPDEPIFPRDGVFRIVYTGTIYPGKRDPTPLFQAIKMLESQGCLSPEHMQVVFAGLNSDMSTVARREGVEQYVQYAGFVPREDALRMQRDADALLFLEYEAPGVRGILTGKLFEYLFAGPPILAVGISSDSSAGTIIETSGRGYAFGRDVDRLAETLLQMINTPPSIGRRNAIELNPYIRQFSRSEQAGRMLSLIADV